jgi:hypothetical protein
VSFSVKWKIRRLTPFTGRVGTTGACLTSGCLELTTKNIHILLLFKFLVLRIFINSYTVTQLLFQQNALVY